MRDVLYNNLRDSHSEPKRIATSKRIGLLLSRNDKDSLVLAIRLLGFEDVNLYLIHLSQLMSARERLAKSGIFLEKLPLPVLTEATRLASIKLGRKYPVIFIRKSVAAKEISKTLGAGDICTNCHFNNCDECGSVGINNESDDGSANQDGPGYSCRQNAQAQRQNAIEQAENAFMLAVIGCGGSGWAAGEFACGATMVTIVGAPISPGVGAGVGCFVFTTCTAFAFTDYGLKIQQAELQYQDKVAGCPR
ncbi:MAG: hypothetical protein EOO60_05355 [Hymenobacter sp.]|nr:MAG: hypothetical protein EOO60_05355 [Hymenobacter sp.]